jgi:DNA-binding transcriptional ArsR family regulator
MPSLPSPLPDLLVELIAQRFRVLSEPTRIKLVDALRDGPASVSELQAATGASQQNVSKHLAILLESGMVRRTKDGNRAYYSIADESLLKLCEQVCGSLRHQVTQLESLLQVNGGRA